MTAFTLYRVVNRMCLPCLCRTLSLMVFTLVGGASLCGVVALVLLIISTATDYWMQYRYSGNAANHGLWRFCINRKCHAHTLTVGEDSRPHHSHLCRYTTGHLQKLQLYIYIKNFFYPYPSGLVEMCILFFKNIISCHVL